MEILRARLFDNNSNHGFFLDMPKARGGRRDGLPCKAKRRLFQNDSPAGVENSQAEANLRNSDTGKNSSRERLEDRYTDIEEFKNPPTPYRTVCHSGDKNGLKSTQKVENADENSEAPSTGSKRGLSRSASQTQSRLQEYYKPKKRIKTSATPLLKTPEGPMRTRSGRRGATLSQKT